MNQTLLDRIIALRDRDQQVRSRLLAEGRLYEGYAEEMQRVHIDNAEALSAIVAEHGWPGEALVGAEGCRAAWTVAQHAICSPQAQRQFLHALNAAVAEGQAPKRMAAMLTDRIRFNEHRPQLYGTVLGWNDAGELDCEVEQPEQLDLRRAEVGLPPFAQDRARHRAAVAAEGGKAPADIAGFLRKQREWAESVGWI
jgi:hypothetical protein